MGYTEDDSYVRVDFFKSSGEWYTTEGVEWTGKYSKGLIHDEFAKSLLDHFNGSDRLCEMDAICLEPYHINSHPIQLKNGEWLHERRNNKENKE